MKLFYRSVLLVLAGVLFFMGVGIVLTWAPDKTVEVLKVRWAQPPSQFLAIDGMQAHVRDEGPRDDPLPIVLLHGTSASLHTWEGWARDLREKRRVIRVDLPGFALTGPQPKDDYSIEAYVRFVVATLDALGVRRCVLAGNSLGGQIAWSTAHAMPGRVDRLILVDASGYPPEQAATKIEVPLGFHIARMPGVRWLTTFVLPRGVVEGSVRKVYGDPSRVTPELVDLYADMALREGNRRALGQRMDQRTTRNYGDIAKLKLPTLVLWGGRDRLTPREFGDRFAREIAGARLVVFDELGHVPHEEDPKRTLVPVREFLGL
jgi:pimeloyl-ACP methyl ester carboxylesterase